MMRARRTWLVAIGAGCVAVAGAFVAGRLWAAGIPSTGALTYSGTLEDGSGVPATGTKTVDVLFWSSATPGTATTCQATDTVNLVAGRFSLLLPDGCTQFVKDNPNVWVEVRVGGTSLGTLSKLGAVPYAVESDHATSADNAGNAAPGGALDVRIGSLEGASPRKSGFRAHKTIGQSIPSMVYMKVSYDAEDFDFDNEFDPATSVFTTISGGYYQVECAIIWTAGAKGTITTYWEADLYVNAIRRRYEGSVTDGYYAGRSVRDLVKLLPGDTVYCGGEQESSTAQAISGDNFSVFEAIRISP